MAIRASNNRHIDGRAKHALHGSIIAQPCLYRLSGQAQVTVQRAPPGAIAEGRAADKKFKTAWLWQRLDIRLRIGEGRAFV